jgi:hypothetical protein
MEKITVEQVWEKLGDTPVDENDNLDEDFVIEEMDITFKKGTDKFEVWHWIEESFDISIGDTFFNL